MNEFDIYWIFLITAVRLEPDQISPKFEAANVQPLRFPTLLSTAFTYRFPAPDSRNNPNIFAIIVFLSAKTASVHFSFFNFFKIFWRLVWIEHFGNALNTSEIVSRHARICQCRTRATQKVITVIFHYSEISWIAKKKDLVAAEVQ